MSNKVILKLKLFNYLNAILNYVNRNGAENLQVQFSIQILNKRILVFKI